MGDTSAEITLLILPVGNMANDNPSQGSFCQSPLLISQWECSCLLFLPFHLLPYLQYSLSSFTLWDPCCGEWCHVLSAVSSSPKIVHFKFFFTIILGQCSSAMRYVILTIRVRKHALRSFCCHYCLLVHCLRLRDFMSESCLIRVLPHFRAITHVQNVGNRFVNLRLMKTKAEKETAVCAVCLQIQISLALHQFHTPWQKKECFFRIYHRYWNLFCFTDKCPGTVLLLLLLLLLDCSLQCVLQRENSRTVLRNSWKFPSQPSSGSETNMSYYPEQSFVRLMPASTSFCANWADGA